MQLRQELGADARPTMEVIGVLRDTYIGSLQLATHAIVGVVVDDEGIGLRHCPALIEDTAAVKGGEIARYETADQARVGSTASIENPAATPPWGGLQSGSSQEEALLLRTVLWLRVSLPELKIPPPSPLLTPLLAITLWVRVATPEFIMDLQEGSCDKRQ
jgi:hypothetical protein